MLKSFFSGPDLLREVLEERYGVAVGIAEPADEFQEFSLDEMQYLASVLEDLPSGFRNLPGLEKVVRRKNGLTNPTYPQAPAIAWIDLGYIEFMDFAFTSGDAEHIRRLIAHEAAHFLWHKVLSEQTRDEFMALSGWSQTPSLEAALASAAPADDHPKATAGPATGVGGEAETAEIWYRATTTNFASAYTAELNPDEDFAETLSYYVYSPDLVRTLAPRKYAFVKDVVDGYEYVTLVDERFTFQVFNLEPDFTFPGKIVGIDTQVRRSVNGDNLVTATLHLSSAYVDGAESAMGRLSSPADTYLDLRFYRVNDDPYTLSTEFTLNRYAAAGYWNIGQITVTDTVDNRRFEGQDQFGWQLFIDNPDDDLQAPVADLTGITSEVLDVDGQQAMRVVIPLMMRTWPAWAAMRRFSSTTASSKWSSTLATMPATARWCSRSPCAPTWPPASGCSASSGCPMRPGTRAVTT